MFWHSTSADRPAARTLAVSLLVHSVTIALLWTLHSSEPLRARPARVTLLAPQFHLPARVPPKRFPPLVQHSVRATVRTFQVPHRLAQPAPLRMAVTVPEPPSIPPPNIAPPAPLRQILDLPPAPVHPALAVTGTFGDASIAIATPRTMHPANPSDAFVNFAAAEILFKPRPLYTDEARRLQIEGEVLLEVLFRASGEARVLRMIRGLGHGLDENAISAADEIRFRPARRGGAAVDSSAVVHIVFQVAH